MTAYTFMLRTRERGQLLGQAVICLEARYASVHRPTSPNPDRRFATLAQWKAIEQELDANLPASPLDERSAIVQVLVGEKAGQVHVQYLSAEPIPEGTAPDKVIVELDQRLRLVQV